MSDEFKLGQVVYVMYRNPHTQNVANIQEAAVVENPDHAGEKCLYLYETYYPINEEMAIYKNIEEAEQAFQYYFGDADEEEFYG